MDASGSDRQRVAGAINRGGEAGTRLFMTRGWISRFGSPVRRRHAARWIVGRAHVNELCTRPHRVRDLVPRVRVAPCTLRGKPLGAPAEGRAGVLEAHESERAERAIAANYGLFRKLYEGVGSRLSIELLYVEIEPASAAAAAPADAD